MGWRIQSGCVHAIKWMVDRNYLLKCWRYSTFLKQRLASVMTWLNFGFLWPVPLLHKLHCLVDVVLSHVNLWSTYVHDNGEISWLIKQWWPNLLGPAWTNSSSCNNHSLNVWCSICYKGRHLENYFIHSIQWMKAWKYLVPVEECSEDEDDGREGEPGGLTNVTPA